MKLAIDFRTGFTRTQIKKSRSPRRGPIVDQAYLTFIRLQPCVACMKHGSVQDSPTEAAHVGERGMGQKCSDRETLPLCGSEHHRTGRESHHVIGRKFWERHKLNRERLIAELNAQFDMETGSVSVNRAPADVPWANEAGQTRRRMLSEELYRESYQERE